ncbi:G-D-S-L family lipolytic protein [Mariniflexile aquimaris]|uniref:G-D-S-L family lipolytic protein n=1 Tax=Mariniflexile aquimaris TaxID=881009 RepID=A0ABW3BPF8_9FLAO
MKTKIMNTKYIGLLLIFLGFTACNTIDDIDRMDPVMDLPALTSGSADFTKYVAVGASFTAGFTDNALFIKGQENSFPNIMAKEFTKIGGGTFTQPLMSDNIGGFLSGGVQSTSYLPRLYFNGTGPALLPATSTTNQSTVLSNAPFNNMGVPGAKSFHLTIAGYGALNPYFGRMAKTPASSMLGDATSQSPTFFTLSEIGGNDVLAYATGGGVGVDQTGNFNPALYGQSDITDPTVFGQAFTAIVNGLTANGAKGAVGTVPYITRLPYFTTVPFKPLSPTNPSFGPLIPTLNGVFGQLNQVYTYLQSVGAINNATQRSITFSTTAASAVVIKDETLTDISGQIAGVLAASPSFDALLQSFGLPTDATTKATVAGLFGSFYGQTRQATATDLLVLPSSSIIGTVNTTTYSNLISAGLSPALAGQFSVEGVTNPLADKWVLLPSEQLAVKNAVDAYNITINNVAAAKGLAVVDFSAILETGATTGIVTNPYILTTKLVTGGLVSLDGVHLTSRGYAVMANKFLEAIDIAYGSNFVASGNVASAGNYPTNYSPALR